MAIYQNSQGINYTPAAGYTPPSTDRLIQADPQNPAPNNVPMTPSQLKPGNPNPAPIAGSPAPAPTNNIPAPQSQMGTNQPAPTLPPLSTLVGTRASQANPQTTEYFNAQTGQGFARPEDLFNYLGGLGYKINDFGALNQQLKTSQTPSTGNYTSGTPTTVGKDGTVTPGTPAPTADTSPAKSVLDNYSVSPTPSVSPLSSYTQAFTNVLQSLGLGDIKTEIDNVTKQYDTLSNSKADAINAINDDPWLTESERQEKLTKNDNDYATKLDALTNQLGLYNSVYQNGISEANFVAGQATSEYQFDVNTQMQLQQNALTQATNAKQFALSENITHPFYNIGGTIYRTSDGFAFSTPTQFQQQTGMTLDQAQTTGQVQSVVGGSFPPTVILPSPYSPGGTVNAQGVFVAFASPSSNGAVNYSPNDPSRITDNNNPTAMTTDAAAAMGLVQGIDYTQGSPFTGKDGKTYYTAKLLGDPIATTIKAIDNGGFYTASGQPRWYDVPQLDPNMVANWGNLSMSDKSSVVQQLYQGEGGKGTLTVQPIDSSPPDPAAANVPLSQYNGYTLNAMYNQAVEYMFKGGSLQQFVGGLSATDPKAKAIKAYISGKAASIASDLGQSFPQLQAMYKANSAAATKLVTQAIFVKTYLNTATDNLNLAVTASANIPRTGAKFVNNYLQWAQGNFTPAGPLAQFETYIYTASREYAKVTSGGASSAQGLTDSASAEASKLINAAQSPEAFAAAAGAMKQDMANVINNLDSSVNGLSSSLGVVNPSANNSTSTGSTDINSLRSKYGY